MTLALSASDRAAQLARHKAEIDGSARITQVRAGLQARLSTSLRAEIAVRHDSGSGGYRQTTAKAELSMSF